MRILSIFLCVVLAVVHATPMHMAAKYAVERVPPRLKEATIEILSAHMARLNFTICEPIPNALMMFEYIHLGLHFPLYQQTLSNSRVPFFALGDSATPASLRRTMNGRQTFCHSGLRDFDYPRPVGYTGGYPSIPETYRDKLFVYVTEPGNSNTVACELEVDGNIEILD